MEEMSVCEAEEGMRQVLKNVTVSVYILVFVCAAWCVIVGMCV